MAEAVTPQARYDRLCEAFFSRGDLAASEMKRFGASALTIDGRIFALLTGDRLVVKLPRARVDALVGSGGGVRFDGGRGRPMKAWLTVDPSREGDWATLAEEALAFVRAEGKRR